jgi:hypothetical protein
MKEELINKIIADIQSIVFEQKALAKEIRDIKKELNMAFDISESDPMELLDELDRASSGQ